MLVNISIPFHSKYFFSLIKIFIYLVDNIIFLEWLKYNIINTLEIWKSDAVTLTLHAVF